jgi:hypothetical protein
MNASSRTAYAAAVEGRHSAARRRLRIAQLALVGASAALFAGTAALARAHFPGHRKHEVTPLGPPAPLVQTVRRNQLAAGIVAPAQAPPGIGSAPS